MIRILSFIVFFSSSLFAQGSAEKGYYITKNNVRTEGYFKTTNFEDINSENNPMLLFKENLNEKYSPISTLNVKEFGIGSDIKYKKLIVQIDNSDFFKDYDYEKELILVNKELFLNVLVEGDASLYEYQTEKGNKYFYQIKSKGKELQQLHYKKYLILVNYINSEKENFGFRKQLFDNVICEGQLDVDYVRIKYTTNELVPIFENFNKCKNSNFVTFKNKLRKEAKLNITPFFGMRRTSLSIDQANSISSTKNDITYGFGAEIELLLPSRKWGLALKAEYEKIDDDLDARFKSLNSTFQRNVIDVTSLNIYIGPKYHIDINKVNSLFIDSFVVLNFPNGQIKNYQINTLNPDQEIFTGSFKTITNTFFSVGVGYVFKKKYGIDFHYDTSRNFLPNRSGSTMSTSFSRIALNLRYLIN